MRRFFVSRIESPDGMVTLSDDETRHLAKVLRKKPGDLVELVIGEGGRAKASVVSLGPENAVVRVLEMIPAPINAGFSLTVAQGLLKAGKMDDLVRSCVELGVRRYFAYETSRSVCRLDEKRAGEKRTRWAKIAREAMKQSGRPDEPEIGPVLSFSGLLALAGEYDLAVAFYEEKKGPLVLPREKNFAPRSVLAALGPEGGFSPDEAGALTEAGFVLAGLGPRVLRAETATLAAAALLCFIYGDMGPR